MALYWRNGKEVSGCIVSKAQYALGKKDSYHNDRRCTREYWESVIRRLAEVKYPDIPISHIESAIERYVEIFREN